MMKLSKGVLGLKFMRKTREQIVKEDTEKKHREHCKVEVESQSSSSLIQVKTEPGSQSQLKSTDCKVIVCPSYLHCERFNYARQSYGGMNPSVEENIRKGHWSMEYEISEAEDEETLVQVKKEELMDDVDDGDDFEDGEIESDKNMDSDEEDRKAIEGPVYGSIIATIGKKFNKKWKQKKTEQPESRKQRNRKRPHEDPQDRHDQAVIPNKKKKKGFWRKNKQKNKDKN